MTTLPPMGLPITHPIQLHPLDQERLELQGSLPDLPLLVDPHVLAELRDPPFSVHTLETSDRSSTDGSERTPPLNPPADLDPANHRQDHTYRGFLLKPRMDAYVRAREIYADVDDSFSGKLSLRLQNCRKGAWFVQHIETGVIKVASSRCKLRWCPICRDVSRHIITIAVDDWLVSTLFPKMLTFTLEHNDDPLTDQIQKLYDSFRKIRRRALLQNAITGGIWFFQLKYNHTSEQWHPHIHCLVDGKLIPHNKLKRLWHEVTHDSFIVDIRSVHDLDSASTEVARYATSPCDIAALSRNLALEVYHATKHRRICGAWGNAKGTTLAPQPQDDHDQWRHVADFYFVSTHRAHVPHLKDFWNCYKTGQPYTGPPPQDERDLFRDELALHFDPLAAILDPHLRFLKIVEMGENEFFTDQNRKD